VAVTAGLIRRTDPSVNTEFSASAAVIRASPHARKHAHARAQARTHAHMHAQVRFGIASTATSMRYLNSKRCCLKASNDCYRAIIADDTVTAVMVS
jgi:hypothetical protein